MYCGPLTKQELLDSGITSVYLTEEGWKITRFWYVGNSKVKQEKQLKISPGTRKHKYRPDKVYPIVVWSDRVRKKHYSIPLSRLIYVWFIGDILEPGMQVDHIDNNPYNNDPENLKLLTIQENLEKRFLDNPDSWTNQWGKPKGYNNEN